MGYVQRSHVFPWLHALALVVLLLQVDHTCSMSSADMSDVSSSSFEPARASRLLLGFLHEEGPVPTGIHVNKIGGLPSWPFPPPPLELQTPGCPKCDKVGVVWHRGATLRRPKLYTV